MGGVDAEAAKERALLEFLLPIWRADLQAELGYRHQPEPFLASVPLRVFAASEDATLPVEEARRWEAFAERVEVREVPGGHFFHREGSSAEDLVASVAELLRPQ